MQSVPVQGVNMRDKRQVKTFPSHRAMARFISGAKSTVCVKSLSETGGFVQGNKHQWYVCPREVQPKS